MTDLGADSQEKIAELQLLEQNLQNSLAQKQQFQMQLVEVDSAIKELKDEKDAYKIVGNIMVKQTKEELDKDLNEKKEMLELRIKNIDKQDEKLREKAKSIQQEILSKIKK